MLYICTFTFDNILVLLLSNNFTKYLYFHLSIFFEYILHPYIYIYKYTNLNTNSKYFFFLLIQFTQLKQVNPTVKAI